MKARVFIDVIVYFLVSLFVYTALSKLFDMSGFRNTLWKSKLIREYYIIVSNTIPSVEILISLLLIIPQTQKIGILAAAILMALFTLYVGIILGIQKNLPCSCGGIMGELTWKTHLWVNLVITIISFLAYTKYQEKRPKKDTSIQKNVIAKN